MKKLSLIFIVLLFSYISFAQDTNREMSNYEKYVIQMQNEQTKSALQQIEKAQKDQDTLKMTKKEWDDLYYSKADAKAERKAKRKAYVDPVQAFVDTLKQDNPNIAVNVYDLDPFYYSDRIGRFYYGGFNRWQYSYPWYYNSWMYEDYGWGWNPYYGYYNYPYYNDFYFGFGYTTFGNYWRPFPDWGFGFGYGWWYSNWSPWRHNHEWYNHSYYGNHDGGFGNYNHKNPIHYQTQTSTNINRRTVQPQTKSLYSRTNRSYSPSYNNPRMSTRPAYNNSRVTTSNLFNRRANVNTQSNTQRSIAPNNQRMTQSRSYSVPSRSYNSPRGSSNYSSGSVSRSSNYSSGSYSSGGGSRSSSSYSGGSSSGGGRSSGGSSGRR